MVQTHAEKRCNKNNPDEPTSIASPGVLLPNPLRGPHRRGRCHPAIEHLCLSRPPCGASAEEDCGLQQGLLVLFWRFLYNIAIHSYRYSQEKLSTSTGRISSNLKKCINTHKHRSSVNIFPLWARQSSQGAQSSGPSVPSGPRRGFTWSIHPGLI